MNLAFLPCPELQLSEIIQEKLISVRENFFLTILRVDIHYGGKSAYLHEAFTKLQLPEKRLQQRVKKVSDEIGHLEDQSPNFQSGSVLIRYAARYI